MNHQVTCRHDPRGSLWRRWDLHFHTPASYDYDDKSVKNGQIIDRLVEEGLDVVAVTDHHRMDIKSIRDLQNLGGQRLTILPGIELRDDHGSEPVHYICIFPEYCDLDHVWTTIQGRLGLTTMGIRNRGGDDEVYVPIEEGASLAQELGGVISIHAGAKTNSIESIRNSTAFQQRIKYDITSKYVDLMEVGQLKDIDVHLRKIFPDTGLNKPLIICSDNHDIKDYKTKTRLWLRADPTFRGLLMVTREPRDRVFVGERPPQFARVERNSTKYVKAISFKNRGEADPSQCWFTGTYPFNPGLVAIIGNKGSGKSALADTLGLLGATKNESSFSFLKPDRFRHPTRGHADHFEATLEWTSGETTTCCLADSVSPEAVERLKYLPQDHVEQVCNELAGGGESAFEQELKKVIFSHVPEPQRLGHATLDGLIWFQTGEKQKRIDTLISQLREISRTRVTYEANNDPLIRRSIVEQIHRRQLELDAHDKAKPAEREDPSKNPGNQLDPLLLATVSHAEAKKKSLTDAISDATFSLKSSERRIAVAERILERIENWEKDFEILKASLAEDASELQLETQDLVSIVVKSEAVQKIRDKARQSVIQTEILLEGDALASGGLIRQLSEIDQTIAELQSQMDAPNRAYQGYLKDLADWQQTRDLIVGNPDAPDSLEGLQAALSALDPLPERIAELKSRQLNLAKQILELKMAQTSILRQFYGPVQSFIDSHELTRGKLQLEFRAELANEDFTERLMVLLALNKRGTFMGIEEGYAKSERYVKNTVWDNPDSVCTFLESIDTALHKDLREDGHQATQLKDQLVKGKDPSEVLNLLYGLEYVKPKYVLRWEGKDIQMLSPGERGTLLLIFYLLVEKGDLPLLIDQPEGNLDNYTVTRVLVDCIKAARLRRQVFIVTHNPNLAVVCDADQVVYASIDKINSNTITYVTGALENQTINKYVTDVLEGTRWAFGVREGKYDIAYRSIGEV